MRTTQVQRTDPLYQDTPALQGYLCVMDELAV
jgi:hypothetical protein